MPEFFELSATELVKLVTSREISVSEVVRSHLGRIEAEESRVQAWAFLDPELAMNTAAVLDGQPAESRTSSMLLGVPVGVKDIFNTVDMPTAMGSPIWEGFTAGNDARVVFYARTNGAVFPGKTVTAEFAVHASGKTLNPVNTDYSPGTSSSGSAAAVACKMVPVALGTQTAASIIRPASYCGVYGYKPSFGLIPRTGVLKTTDSLDTVGMMARCVEDIRLIFDVCRVRGKNFPVSDPILNDRSRQEKGQRPWRLALIPDQTQRYSEPYAHQAFLDFASQLESTGQVEWVDKEFPPEIAEHGHEVHTTIYEKSLSYYFQKEYADTEFTSEIIHQMIRQGNEIGVDQYYEAIDRQVSFTALLDSYLDGVDAVVTLSTAGIAPKLEAAEKTDTCLLWTLCGVPSLTIPLFTGPHDMPFGLQVVGRKYNDYLLLDLAQYLTGTHANNRAQETALGRSD